jgi:ribonuclease HI
MGLWSSVEETNGRDNSVITVYTKGLCKGPSGPGGWAGVIVDEHGTKLLTGCAARTSTNRIELMAAIEALRILPRHRHCIMYSESWYLIDGMTSWVKNWQSNHWITAKGQKVCNQDLWRSLLEVSGGRRMVAWKLVEERDNVYLGMAKDHIAISLNNDPGNRLSGVNAPAGANLSTRIPEKLLNQVFVATLNRKQPIRVYLNGSLGSDGERGGWSAVLHQGDLLTEMMGGLLKTTLVSLELGAACQALSALPYGVEVVFVTNSHYISKGLTNEPERLERIRSWDMWAKLSELSKLYKIKWESVKEDSDAAVALSQRTRDLAFASIPR